MSRSTRSVNGQADLNNSLELVETVFTDSEGEQSGKTLRNLVEEIRSKRYYLPELDLIAVNEENAVIGHAMFSRFHLGEKYENQLLLLTPEAIKTQLQRQHISKELIEFGFERAKKMGCRTVIVEGDPRNYNPRGFETSCKYGIFAGATVPLPRPECLMVKELQDGALQDIKGTVDYSDYRFLT